MKDEYPHEYVVNNFESIAGVVSFLESSREEPVSNQQHLVLLDTLRDLNKSPLMIVGSRSSNGTHSPTHTCEFIDNGFSKEMWCKHEGCKNTKEF